MRVVANGTDRHVPDGLTVEALLGVLALRPDSVAVERNGEALSRSDFSQVTVLDGDRFEIVKAVAGG